MTADLLLAEVVTKRPLNATEARALVNAMRYGVSIIGEQIVTAYKGRAWVALGYGTWDAMCEGEFAGARLRIPREDRAEQVQSLRAEGLSVRAISNVLGVSKSAVSRDLPGVPDGTPEPTPVTGQDGKTYAPTRPTAKVTETTKTETVVDTDTGEVVSPEQWAKTPVERKVVEPTNAQLDQQVVEALGADHQFLSNLIAATDPKFLRLPPHRVVETYQPGTDDAGAVDNFLARLDAWLSEVQAGVRRTHLRSVR